VNVRFSSNSPIHRRVIIPGFFLPAGQPPLFQRLSFDWHPPRYSPCAPPLRFFAVTGLMQNDSFFGGWWMLGSLPFTEQHSPQGHARSSFLSVESIHSFRVLTISSSFPIGNFDCFFFSREKTGMAPLFVSAPFTHAKVTFAPPLISWCFFFLLRK